MVPDDLESRLAEETVRQRLTSNELAAGAMAKHLLARRTSGFFHHISAPSYVELRLALGREPDVCFGSAVSESGSGGTRPGMAAEQNSHGVRNRPGSRSEL